MTRRRKLLLASAALAAAGVLALPGVHWRLIGWWRGEPFYNGRPATYWASELRSFHPAEDRIHEDWYGLWEAGPRPVAWLKSILLGPNSAVRLVEESHLPLADAGPDALPVLRQLSANSDAGVAGWAGYLVRKIDSDALQEAADRP